MGLLDKLEQVEIKADSRLPEDDLMFCETQQQAYDESCRALREIRQQWKKAIQTQRDLLGIGQDGSLPYFGSNYRFGITDLNRELEKFHSRFISELTQHFNEKYSVTISTDAIKEHLIPAEPDPYKCDKDTGNTYHRILERRVPVTEENPERSKRGLYKIKDNYLRFWFAFIYPNMSFIESGHSGIVMDKIRKGLTTSHIGFVYEDICEERMWELNVNNTWPFQFSKLGGYWDAKNEIDIAALDPEGKNMILGECKYWKEPVGLNVLHALEAKACDVAWERDRRKVWYVLFSISGFSDELCAHAATRDDLLLIDDRGR